MEAPGWRGLHPNRPARPLTGPGFQGVRPCASVGQRRPCKAHQFAGRPDAGTDGSRPGCRRQCRLMRPSRPKFSGSAYPFLGRRGPESVSGTQNPWFGTSAARYVTNPPADDATQTEKNGGAPRAPPSPGRKRPAARLCDAAGGCKPKPPKIPTGVSGREGLSHRQRNRAALDWTFRIRVALVGFRGGAGSVTQPGRQ